MHVKKDREDAESKALKIFKLGPPALDILIDISVSTDIEVLEGDTRKQRIRAVIFTLSIFAAKDKSSFKDSERFTDAILFLYTVSKQGFQSADSLLAFLGVSDEDVEKTILMSLPIVDTYAHDHYISLAEAVEEIRLARKNLYGTKGVVNDHFMLGTDKKHHFALYRIAKKKFIVRSRRLK